MEVFQGGKDGNTEKEFKLPPNFWKRVALGAVVVAAIWLGSSTYYTVEETEQAAILTFGKYTTTQESSGLHFKLPYPIQQAVKVPANLTQKTQIGYREHNGQITPVEEEALMITGDENIVSADAVVEWKIANVRDYLYNIDNAEHFLRNSASSAIRSVMGSTKLDYAITEGKTVIQTDVKKKLEELQERYNTGIQIIDLKFQDIEPPEGQVATAFKEVTNAREEKNTKINQATKYVNDRLPKARGEAQALLEGAEAEKKSRILNAQGDVAKFNAVYTEYVKNPEVTSERLLLETIERILPNAKIIVTDGSGSTVNYLPLDELLKPRTGTGTGTGANASSSANAGAPAASTGTNATEGGAGQ